MSQTPSNTQIERFAAVSQVLAKVAAGMTFSRAIRAVAKLDLRGLDGRRMHTSVRTLQRWMAAYQAGGIEALKPASRLSSRPSTVLSEDFLNFLVRTKTGDPDASIPEVIRQAKFEGIVGEGDGVSRVSVWRAACRLNLPIFATKGGDGADDKRRFAYQHRMQMVLADGKYFRVGGNNRKRVVVTFLDDATRFALGAIVGKSESAALFLRGIWKVVRRWGLIETFFLDNGSGFIARDVALVASRLGIGIIHGTEGYPEGHGKIERYHQTLWNDLLRAFPGNIGISSELESLEFRIEHYLQHEYNRRIHESLSGLSPEQRFLSDMLPLKAVDKPEQARQLFNITKIRKVSRDNVVMVGRVPYEMPKGYAGKRVEIHHHLLDRTVSIIHEGRLIELHRVDLVLNARTRRATTKVDDVIKPRPSTTAAMRRFQKDHQPLVGESGDFFEET
jgi:putative transposase